MKECKMIMIYINQSHKGILEKFFDKIDFYYYTIQNKIESVWSKKLKHKNTSIWPGTDCIFYLWVLEDQVEDMLSKLKTFRASLPYDLVFSIGIIPIERTIPDLLKMEDIEVDEELLADLKENKLKK